MFDFPNTPTLNQTVTGSNGCLYRWDGVKWAASSSAPDVAANNVGRNFIHNGMFNIWQRGAGAFSNNVYGPDRWFVSSSFDTFTVQRYSYADSERVVIGDESARYCSLVNVTGSASAGAYSFLQQSIENVSRVSNKTVTVSFWANGGAPGLKLGVSLDQGFGTGGSPSSAVTGNGQSVTLTTAQVRYSMTFTLPSISGKILGTNNDSRVVLNFWFSSSTTYTTRSGNIGVQSGAFALWGVQLEIGSVATPLEKLDIQTDLANCQRFYQLHPSVHVSGYAPGSNLILTTMAYPVTMRAIPTVTFASTGGTNAGAMSMYVINNALMIPSAPITTTGWGYVNASIILSADL